MRSRTSWWAVGPLALALIVAACDGDAGNDDGDGAAATAAPAGTAAPTAVPTIAPTAIPTSEPTDDGGGATDAASAVLVYGDEEIPIEILRCFFEEQPRAGLGGVYTHTAQGSGTNGDGEPVVLDVSRAVSEEDEVEVDVIVDIGDPRSDDAISKRGTGGDELVTFGDASIAADGVEVTDFETDPVTVSFDLSCG